MDYISTKTDFAIPKNISRKIVDEPVTAPKMVILYLSDHENKSVLNITDQRQKQILKNIFTRVTYIKKQSLLIIHPMNCFEQLSVLPKNRFFYIIYVTMNFITRLLHSKSLKSGFL